MRAPVSPLHVVGVLAAGSALGVGCIAVRVFGTGGMGYTFLLWNLFLAWIPLGLAYWLYRRSLRAVSAAVSVAIAVLWLLFFPNAPYLGTDLMHLRFGGVAPLWFDSALLLLFALLGFFLAFVSLHLVHRVVRRRFGGAFGWGFVVVAAGLSGLGVYLGRFGRWNSWDVVTRPGSLLLDVWDRVSQPWRHGRTVASSLMNAAILLVVYALLYALMHVRFEGVRRPAPAEKPAVW